MRLQNLEVPCCFISALLALSVPSVQGQEFGPNFGRNLAHITRALGQVRKAPFSLLARGDIQDELSLTEEQIANLEELRESQPQPADILKRLGFTSFAEMDEEATKQIAVRLVPELKQRLNRALGAISAILNAKQQTRLKQIWIQDLVLRHRRITQIDLKSVYDDVDLDASKLKDVNAAVLKVEAEIRDEAEDRAKREKLRVAKYIEAWQSVLGESLTKSLMGEPFAFESSSFNGDRFFGGRFRHPLRGRRSDEE